MIWPSRGRRTEVSGLLRVLGLRLRSSWSRLGYLGQLGSGSERSRRGTLGLCV